MLNRLFTLLLPARPIAQDLPDKGGSNSASPPAFRISGRNVGARVTGDPPLRKSDSRHQQLIGLALENLHAAARRSSVSDMTAAAIDLNRVACNAGKAPQQLLNAPDPSGGHLLDQVALARHDVRAKVDLLVSIGCNLHATNLAGDNGLHAAARQNNSVLVDTLAMRARPLLTQATGRIQTYSHATPLAVAIVAGHATVVKQLVLLGSNLSAVCCLDSDRQPLNPQQLYARLDHRTPEMSAVLRHARTPR
ncbi:hypothetical protein BH09PSE5_BH09PSE5_50000 [soil metagenome]